MSTNDLRLANATTLAFVGDAVYSLLAREHLSANHNIKIKDLHAQTANFVCAAAQARAFQVLKPVLFEDELAIFKRGRNLSLNNIPKSATVQEYHNATGLECLFGYLHLSKNHVRLHELFEICVKASS